ncbi:FimV/HubP family polar landmark protein [Massilia sp. W12]|uniref:FimV/HubP family polar landmark protein n=1 Tax=Massilia sp. W12 TaxID=3126507 RepID=UPI0030CAB0D6
MGKLTVLSALGQPLNAEIELTAVTPDEVGSLAAKLAPAEAYKQANIEFNPALLSLRFAVDQRGSRNFIRISSSQPVNEPFVDMLLELSSSNGRIVREYTFLLDPADLKTTQSAQIASGADKGKSAATAVAAASPASTAAAADSGKKPLGKGRGKAVKPAAEKAPEQAADSTAAAPAKEEGKTAAKTGDNYEVKKGDTLGKIARELKPEGISLDQMLAALYRANTNAFVGNNMNRLRSGQILNVPDADAAKAIPQAEARSLVLAQADDFNSYRNKLAGQVEAAPAKGADVKQSGSGKIGAKIEERPTATSEAADKLKLSKAGKPADEDKIAQNKQLAEAKARVSELEKNIAELNKLVEVKNKALAEQSKKPEVKPSASAKASATPTPTPSPTPAAKPSPTPTPAPSPTPAVKPEVKQEVKAEVKPEIKPSASASALATPTPAASAAASAAASMASAAASAPADAQATPTPSVTPSPAPMKKKTIVPPPPPPPPEPGFFESLTDNALFWPVLAAGGLLAGGLAFLGIRRRREAEQSKFESSMLGESSMVANSMFGQTGGQSVDTNNSVFNSNFAPSASQLDANEVDPVAEADVYIAYGRDVQAEEILKEALRSQPERTAVRLKLLEIYASRKDTRAFEVQAGELYSLTQGEGDDWAQAAALGQSIDPNNPMYATGDAPAAKPDPILASSTEPLEDLDPEALLVSTQQPGPAPAPAPAAAAEDDFNFDLPEDAADQLSALDLDLGAQAPAPAPAPTAAPAPAEEDVLDFDLGGLNFAPPPAAAAAAPVAAPAMPDLSAVDLDFPTEAPQAVAAPAPAAEVDDFDFGDFNLDAPAPAPAPAPLEDMQATAKFDAASMDLDLPDFDEDATIIAHAPAAPAAAPQLDPLPDLGLSLDLPQVDAAAADVPELDLAAELAAAEAGMSLDSVPDLDFGAEQETMHAAAPVSADDAELAGMLDELASLDAPQADAPPPLANMETEEFDLGALDLDLKQEDAPAALDDLSAGDGEMSSAQMEMETKLDLAIAYQEIGDKEGARELIDEVIKGGSPEQVEKAKAMRAKLA